MARTARCVIVRAAHHVVAREVNRHKLFESGFETWRYRERFARIAESEGFLSVDIAPGTITFTGC